MDITMTSDLRALVPRSPAAEVIIRGVRLPLGELTHPTLQDADHLDALHQRMLAAKPFPHLVVEDWFNPVLLQLVREEFDDVDRSGWSTETNRYARVERSRGSAGLGPASKLYFATLHSAFFVNVLSRVSGVSDLIADPYLQGGGLHETVAGGSFGIHTDFDRHPCTALNNEMVFITYLNKDWKPEWRGALELWDATKRVCAARIEPDFGRSILMTHGRTHFHGHPAPLAAPPGVTRRSVAAYFYANRFAREDRREPMLSKFLFATRSDRAKAIARQWLPPILLARLKRMGRS